MSSIDSIWDECDSIFSHWGLREIPFSESVSPSRITELHEVFTGRETELRKVLNLLKGQERKRILIYGWAGIGKTAFILEILGVLQRKAKDTLTAYISLPPETDLATAALIALALAMDNDEWAQQQLNQMGLPPINPVTHNTTEIKMDIFGIGGRIEKEESNITPPKFPSLSFEGLLNRALSKYSRVVIAIDDVDKQDPARVRQLLHDAQGMLKSDVCFILTGHPSGITRDILTSERGLFDLTLKLEELDMSTTYQMLINYLNSVRPKNSRYDYEDPRSINPFTQEAAQTLCKRSGGVPRWLNRLGNYVLLKAAELQADLITTDVLQQGLEYANQQLRGQQNLTPEDYYVLDLVLEKRILSDATITITDLERVKVKEFSEILPVLDKLIQFDLVRRLPTEHTSDYEATPMLLGEHGKPDREKDVRPVISGGTGITAGGDVTFGDVSGQFAAGDHIEQIQSIEQTDLEELRKSLLAFQEQVAHLGLSPNYQNVVNGAISAAVIEAEEDKPTLSKIKEGFESALNTIKKAGKTIQETSELYEPAKKIAQLIGVSLSPLL
ncbi:MAG: ATP-binding protein [Candidatus Omnitrophica bacterium]|nr:ATP-binding protein [Candidatus Omnitrophota bacterium]